MNFKLLLKDVICNKLVTSHSLPYLLPLLLLLIFKHQLLSYVWFALYTVLSLVANFLFYFVVWVHLYYHSVYLYSLVQFILCHNYDA